MSRKWLNGGDAIWTWRESEFIQDLILASAKHVIDLDGIIETYFQNFEDVGRTNKSLNKHILREYEALRKEIIGDGTVEGCAGLPLGAENQSLRSRLADDGADPKAG